MVQKNPYTQLTKDFPPPETPLSLTVRDLVEARELYHAALAIMPDVIGTAIGLYRFRQEEGGKPGDQPDLLPRERNSQARTLFNSIVTEDSQPAILFFVKKWTPFNELPEDPRFIIPQRLYLPSGQAVPTCIIQLDLDEEVDPTASDANRISFPENLIGGGCGVYTYVQGQQHVGTVGCLVTDGERLYGLTSRHVVGPAGQPIFTRVRGKEKPIGQSDVLQMKKKRFCDIYPDYKGGDAVACMDAGLIRIDQADWWTSQVLHVGKLGDVADLHTASITLGMIGTPLKSAGAVSGDQMKGEISALFPRYRGMGGVDYLADVLIGPRPGQKKDEFRVAGGDSGSLWVLDLPKDPGAKPEASEQEVDKAPLATPVAVTWAAVDLVGGGASRQLVLATFVSTICKGLDVELVTRQNIGYRPVWGAENHRTFASVAVGLLDGLDGKLKKFLLGSSRQAAERENALRELAVLPDNWRYKRGRSAEGPNHYADIDKEIGGKPLADVELTYNGWLQFYQAWESKEDNVKHGALPFRIGQVFDDLVKYLAESNYKWAYAAAGALIHYVADACNPAHVTIWTKGDPDWTSSQHSRFHGIWDNETIIDAQEVRSVFHNLNGSANIVDGSSATEAARDLMKQTLGLVEVGSFVTDHDAPKSYAACRSFLISPAGRRKITEVVAHGCSLLFSLWTSAWQQGGGGADPKKIEKLKVAGLRDEMLNQPKFLESISLKNLAAGKPA